MVGMQSATDLAALGPGTLLIDYSTYVFSFLAVAGEAVHLPMSGHCVWLCRPPAMQLNFCSQAG